MLFIRNSSYSCLDVITGVPKMDEVTDYTSLGTEASSYACSEAEHDTNYFTISIKNRTIETLK